MELKILSYFEPTDSYECEVMNFNAERPFMGDKIFVDLVVDGSLPKDIIWPRKNLVGKTIECDHLQSYLYIASEVKIKGE